MNIKSVCKDCIVEKNEKNTSLDKSKVGGFCTYCKSCKNKRQKEYKNKKFPDRKRNNKVTCYPGDKFSHLTLLEKTYSTGKEYKFKCNCGIEKSILLGSVYYGTTQSCGCIRKTRASKLNRSLTNKPAYMKAYKYYRDSAKGRNRDFHLEYEICEQLFKSNCHYCGGAPHRRVTTKSGHEAICNGIDRINNDLGYIKDNVVSCCTICNKAKNAFSYDFFQKWLKQVAEFNK